MTNSCSKCGPLPIHSLKGVNNKDGDYSKYSPVLLTYREIFLCLILTPFMLDVLYSTDTPLYVGAC